MPTLYILVGPSGCGKSTWAHNFTEEHPDVMYVSRDEIRFAMLDEDEDYFEHEIEVYRCYCDNIASFLQEGKDVIADATQLNRGSRRKLTKEIDRYITDYEIKYIVFYTPMSVCWMRDSGREGRAHVGEKVIQGMFRTFKAPTLDEDPRANEIIEVGDGKNDFSFLMAPYWKENWNE